ncbi:MAG: SDR family NAD(P)-dependent oxidoreductase [Aestuariibacter sp.]
MKPVASKQQKSQYPVATFRSTLQGDEQCLADHIIQQKKILPGMAYLELARAAVAQAVSLPPDKMLQLSDSVFVNALTVSEPIELTVQVYPGDAGEFGVEVSTTFGIHFQTRVKVKNRKDELLGRTDNGKLDIASLQQTCSQSGPSKQDFYGGFKERDVLLGPSHRGVQKIRKTSNDVEFPKTLVELNLPGSSQNGMAMDPGMLDSVIQGGVVLSSDSEANVVPFAVVRTQVFGPLTDKMYALVEKTKEGLNYIAADENGVIRVVVSGFLTRAIDLHGHKEQINYFVPNWQVQSKNHLRVADNDSIVVAVTAQEDVQEFAQDLLQRIQNLLSAQSNAQQSSLVEVKLISPAKNKGAAYAAIRTVMAEHPEIQCRLKLDGDVYAPVFEPVELANTEEFQWPHSGTVIITGGMGGLGRIVAQDILAGEQPCNLVLTGRSGLNKEKQNWLNELQKVARDAGVQVSYQTCDVTDLSQVQELISSVSDLQGVIHAAGTSKDAYLKQKDAQQLSQVMPVKVQGLKNLDAATKDLPLEFLVAFSSIAGVIGNAGQFDYAMANGFMDDFMHSRQEMVAKGLRQGRSLSVNWPFWESDGMQLDETIVRALWQQHKIRPLPPEHGMLALKSALGSGHSQLVVLYGLKKSVASVLEAPKPSKQAIQSDEVLDQTASGDEQLKLRREIIKAVRQQAATHLKLKPSQLDDDSDWAVFGFDSILLSSFINRCNSAFDINLMPTVLFEATNINLFSDYLLENFGPLMAKKFLQSGVKAPTETQTEIVDKQVVSEDDQGKLRREIIKAVRQQTATHLKLKPSQLDDESDWAVFGFDSILLSSFINRCNSAFGINLMPTVLFEATNINLFSDYLLENFGSLMAKKLLQSGAGAVSENSAADNKSEAVTDTSSAIESESLATGGTFAEGFKQVWRKRSAWREQDVAIVGMSCRIAGAKNPDEFWDMLVNEKDMISEIPAERWDWRDYPGVSKWGSFIDDVDKFDSLFFGISPAEAMYMTPEQRLMMQYVWECIENAGCGGADIRGNNTGLFVGCGPSGYSSILHGLPIEAYSATGTVASVGPNRINYFMDWHGPSHPIDTACSSALVALHRATEAIRAGHCDQAIAGGVNLLLAVDGYVSFAKSGMLCEDGRCKTFSNKANGYVRGEGVGMLMVKRMEHAIRDGNTIHAVVKGSAENHGGRTNSLTAPNPKSQASVIKKALADADMELSRVGYIECHGTGTSLGDPVEINGLKMVAKDLSDTSLHAHPLYLGSIKSNIGHLEYGAGVVGLIKVILQMQNKKIARSLHCDELNPYIDLKGTPFKVAQRAVDWEVPQGERRVAGVSSFGFGGVNAHVVLEEYSQNEHHAANQDTPCLLPVSAKSADRLVDYLRNFSDFLSQPKMQQIHLRDIAYTLQVGRSEMGERVVFVASSLKEWQGQLEKLADDLDVSTAHVYRGTVQRHGKDSLEFNDTDSGRQYLDDLIHSGELEKLAELWVKGIKIPWKSLYKQ